MKLQVIVGSTRPGRTTDRVAKWVAETAKKLPNTEVELVDLRDYDMPLFNEEISPRYNPERKPEAVVQKWMDKITEGDAYVFVTPEYNHSTSGVLKNSFDYLTFQLLRKPTSIVSHGTVGGARAAMHLREILSEARSVVIPTAVAFAGAGQSIDEDGVLDEEATNRPYGPQTALDGLLSELTWYSDALSAARANEA